MMEQGTFLITRNFFNFLFQGEDIYIYIYIKGIVHNSIIVDGLAIIYKLFYNIFTNWFFLERLLQIVDLTNFY